MNTLPILATAALLVISGCGDSIGSPKSAEGLVIVLPGIEGPGMVSQSICEGLKEANVPYAVTVHAWGAPVPLLGMLINQTSILGNRFAGDHLAAIIAKYQDRNPGKPVYVVGHSGGAAIAVFAAEKLAPDRKIDGLVLLSASVSADYDMHKAMDHCRYGVVNFYNPEDLGLQVGVAIFGNVDGGHGLPAGRKGFAAGASVYNNYPRLYQVPLTGDEMSSAGESPHFADTATGFVRTRISPWLLSQTWPPDGE